MHISHIFISYPRKDLALAQKDESLEDTENLPDPDVLAEEIVESLQSALAQFESIAEELGEEKIYNG